MAGRAKQVVYQYDAEGKYMQSWDCIRDLTKAYFPQDKGIRPLFQTKRTRTLKADDSIVSLDRIGRVGVLEYKKRKNNPYVDRPKGGGAMSGKKVEVYNLDNELMATFKDHDIACKMTGIPMGTLFQRLQANPPAHGRDGLKFKVVK